MDPVDDPPGREPPEGSREPPEDSKARQPEHDASAPVTPADGAAATGEGEAGGEDGAEVRDPLRFNNWMKRSATGAVMTGIAVGLQQALELPRQQPAFVIEASGEPEDPDRPIDLRFDPDSPADTVAIIRRPPPVDSPEGPSASS